MVKSRNSVNLFHTSKYNYTHIYSAVVQTAPRTFKMCNTLCNVIHWEFLVTVDVFIQGKIRDMIM